MKLHRIYVAYYLTIAAVFLASFFPELRLWGLNQWAFFSVNVKCEIFLVAIILPFVLNSIIVSEKAERFLGRGHNYFFFAVLCTAVLGAAFLLLRAKTHFLGDGYLVLGSLTSENPTIYQTSFGTVKTLIWLKSFFGGNDEATALLAFRTISIGSGILLSVSTFVLSRQIFDNQLDSALLALGLLSGGWTLLFFGYVEHYGPFVLSVVIFCHLGLLIIQEKANRLLIILPFVLSIFFHLLGITLLLPVIYILFHETRVESWYDNLSKPFKALLFALPIGIGAVLFTYYYQNSYQFRFIFVPIVTDTFTVEGYTLFSLKHILDFMNLTFRLFPGILLILALSIFSNNDRIPTKFYRYFVLLCASTLGAVFLIDPKLGMPRDWDLLSFAGIPLTIALCCFLLFKITPPPAESTCYFAHNLNRVHVSFPQSNSPKYATKRNSRI